MGSEREVKEVRESIPTLEGAGVRLKRAFSYNQAPHLDPFLLLDDFHSSNPEDYARGFPWHPHRGIETITYMLHGEVEHGDSLGNRGVISSGDVQWMTAGSGIIHQEMPKGQDDGLMWGFQLWANLPASRKMMEPRYREVTKDQIPVVELEHGIRVKIICGTVNGIHGPVCDIITDPEYLDVSAPANIEFKHHVEKGYTSFAYTIEGRGRFGTKSDRIVGPESLVVFGDGEGLTVSAQDVGLRFLLVSGKPIGEPVAWRGPIVMNTEEELQLAFAELERGTFLKHSAGR